MSTRVLGAPLASVTLFFALAVLMALAATPAPGGAWVANGTPLVVNPASQEAPAIASDGSAGGIVAWRDSRNGSTSDIYAQRVDASGSVAWSSNGVVVCTATGTQSSPDILADGSFGAVVAWRDDRNGSGDVYAQRVNSLGQAQWLANGIALAASAGNELFPTIISDLSPTPGFIVSYFDRTIGQPPALEVQHVDMSGTGLWVSGHRAASSSHRPSGRRATTRSRATARARPMPFASRSPPQTPRMEKRDSARP